MPCLLVPALAEWADLDRRETGADTCPRHPILIDPESSVDPALARFIARTRFAWLANDRLNAGEGVSGRAARRLIQAVREAATRYEGTFLIPGRPRPAAHPALQVHDNPRAFLACNTTFQAAMLPGRRFSRGGSVART